MTVKELKEALSQYPDELEVCTYWDFENVHSGVNLIKTREWWADAERITKRSVVILYDSAEHEKCDDS